MTPSAPIIHIEHLTKAYRGRPALVDLDLDLHPGRIVGLVGPNGCGKTTLLKILAGVLADWTGTVAIDGIAPGVETKRRVAFLPSAAFLDPALPSWWSWIGMLSAGFLVLAYLLWGLGRLRGLRGRGQGA